MISDSQKRLHAASSTAVANHQSPITNHGSIRILGIDPGSQRTGIGIIDVDAGGRARHVHHQPLVRLGADDFAQRLKVLVQGLHALIEEYQPQEVAIEKVFMAKNADSALKLGQARGSAIVAAVNAGLPVAEYSARQVKQSVVGTGAADKEQVQHMVKQLLKLPACPQADAADALAVALCHTHTQQSLIRMAGKVHGTVRGRLR